MRLVDLTFKITRMWLTDAQIAQPSLADTKQRCEKEEQKNKENLQKMEEHYMIWYQVPIHNEMLRPDMGKCLFASVKGDRNFVLQENWCFDKWAVLQFSDFLLLSEWERTWQSLFTVILLILQRMKVRISKYFHCC